MGQIKKNTKIISENASYSIQLRIQPKINKKKDKKKIDPKIIRGYPCDFLGCRGVKIFKVSTSGTQNMISAINSEALKTTHSFFSGENS